MLIAEVASDLYERLTAWWQHREELHAVAFTACEDQGWLPKQFDFERIGIEGFAIAQVCLVGVGRVPSELESVLAGAERHVSVVLGEEVRIHDAPSRGGDHEALVRLGDSDRCVCIGRRWDVETELPLKNTTAPRARANPAAIPAPNKKRRGGTRPLRGT